MNRKSSSLVIIITFLASTIAGPCASLVMANPGLWLLGFPRDPVKTPPEIVFQSPLNDQTYYSNFMWLNFTIIKPESWFFVADGSYIQPNNYIYVNVTTVSYSVDGITIENTPIIDVTDLLVEKLPSRLLNFSTNMSLPEGEHTLTVHLRCESYYWSSESSIPANISVNFSSEPVHFTIIEPIPEFPSWIIIPLFFLISVIALVSNNYLIKNKKKSASNFSNQT